MNDRGAILESGRLRLRRWRDADRAPFAAINADPRVMTHFPASLSRIDSDALIERIESHFDAHGFGLWALERQQDAALLGFVGLAVPRFEAAFTPCVEIGWRLGFEHWGYGYASEAAAVVLAHGFETLGLTEIVSFTVSANGRSRAVMERLGMRRDPAGDFEHPALAAGHPLRAHVLYRLRRDQWRAARPAGEPGR
ncbi:MAG: GNAT family N-acetyltransferase [Burkholderiaceae bacterium]